MSRGTQSQPFRGVVDRPEIRVEPVGPLEVLAEDLLLLIDAVAGHAFEPLGEPRVQLGAG